MEETVRLGDSFFSLAERILGDGARWQEIELANVLTNPGVLVVDQSIRLAHVAGQGPSRSVSASVAGADFQRLGFSSGQPPTSVPERATKSALVPAYSYVFVVADEINPLRGKVIRRVLTSSRLATAVGRQIGRPIQVFPSPERFGFSASAPHSMLPPGRHAQGMKPSPFQSASRTQPFGARRFAGRPFWIDEAKARAAGATIHETREVIGDLERILARTKNAAGRVELQSIMSGVREDREVLLRGAIPPTAVKGALAMGATRVLQGVQIVGFVMSSINLEHATEHSLNQHSVRPLAEETLRQAGGWAAAWAGMRLGAMGGAALGIETGPGAVLTAAAGSVAGGLAGYYGAGWVADHAGAN